MLNKVESFKLERRNVLKVHSFKNGGQLFKR